MRNRMLLIQRHAKSAWDTDAAVDFDRPLAKRGKRDAPRMARWLRQQDPAPDLIVSSAARRAAQTALTVGATLGIEATSIRWDDRVYEGTTASLLGLLSEFADAPRCLLLIGHNPGLEQLTRYLCGSLPLAHERTKLLPTAAVARLSMPDHWRDLQPGTARLVSITRPRDLEADP